MIDLTHLRIVQALAENGTLTRAAYVLNLTQSALSHQIRHLERKLGIKIWQREGRRLHLTHAGQLLLQTANNVLPVLQQTEHSLRAHAQGRQGILRVGVECYPCHEWLNRIIVHYLEQTPDVDVDIVSHFQFSGLEGLLNHHIDVLITPDKIKQTLLSYNALFNYELMLIVSNDHPLAGKKSIRAEQIASEILITFPVAQERLDVFTQFLWPASVAPMRHKNIAAIDVMLQMTAFNRGVCTLPDWLAESYCQSMPVTAIRMGKTGINKTLYACTREPDLDIPYLQRFIELGRNTGSNTVKLTK